MTSSNGRSAARFAVSQYRPCRTADGSTACGPERRARIHHGLGVDRRAREQPGAHSRLGARDRRLEELADDGIGKRQLELTASSDEHAHPLAAGTSDRCGQQLRLADASRPLDERQRSLARSSRPQRVRRSRRAPGPARADAFRTTLAMGALYAPAHHKSVNHCTDDTCRAAI